jgi:hypothetical protein
MTQQLHANRNYVQVTSICLACLLPHESDLFVLSPKPGDTLCRAGIDTPALAAYPASIASIRIC